MYTKNVRSTIIFYRQCYIVYSRSIFHASMFYYYIIAVCLISVKDTYVNLNIYCNAGAIGP